MTQEEQLKIQAKAYTELINRLEDVKNAIKKQNYGIAMDILYKPYPEFQITTYTELEEGEGERIMGNIIATIHLYYGEPLEDEAKEMIAWLERRGQTFTKKDVDDAYLKGVCDTKHEIEKQGKNNMGISEATKQKLEDNLNKALEKETPESWNKFLDEQKPAWSEEDEDNFKTLVGILNERMNSCDKGTMTYNVYKKIQDWFKSLKERYTWRPSDEQMHYLSWIANIKLGDSVVEQEVSKHLNELLEDLKKLKS